MNTNSKIAQFNRFNLTRSTQCSPKSILAAAAATVCLAVFPMTSAFAWSHNPPTPPTPPANNQLISNCNFDASSNIGTLSIKPGQSPVIGNIGSGPWEGYLSTTKKGSGGLVGIENPSDAGFHGGAGEITNHDSNTNAALFQVTSSTYAANTSYVFTVDFSIECGNNSPGKNTGGISLGATAGAWSTTVNPFASGSNNNSVEQVSNSNNGLTKGTLTFTLNTGTDKSLVGKTIGIYASTASPIANCNHVEFDNACVTVVPEPSTLVLAGIFGFGMLMLFRRYNSVA